MLRLKRSMQPHIRGLFLFCVPCYVCIVLVFPCLFSKQLAHMLNDCCRRCSGHINSSFGIVKTTSQSCLHLSDFYDSATVVELTVSGKAAGQLGYGGDVPGPEL